MPGGRPTIYTAEYAEIARRACMAGATNQSLAAGFSVSRRTIDNWIARIPEFGDAVREGREVADLAVVSALFARTTGMELKKTKVFRYRGKPITATYTEYLPPDISAYIFWLRNRRLAEWRENRMGQSGAQKLEVPIDTSLAGIAQTPRGPGSRSHKEWRTCPR
jgi:hypothetical protein